MDGYIGEVKLFAGNFTPRGWEFCNGQLLSISRYGALFSLLGTTYGGDGHTSFVVPDLRGRVPVHAGDNYRLGAVGGIESTRLDDSNIPPHQHALTNVAINGKVKMKLGAAPGYEVSGVNNFIAIHGGVDDTIFTSTNPGSATLNENGIDSSGLNINGLTDSVGVGNAFDNRPPFLVLNYIICTDGLMPSRS